MIRKNIRLLIAFDGSAYSGWQRQANAPTIQGTIENRLSLMTGDDITLHGAGRTDSGVHALGMVANFITTANIPCGGYLNGLNSMLPRDIRILSAEEAPAEFHSRYSATGKTYSYRFCTGAVQLPTERLYTAHFPGTFVFSPVSDALQRILGSHDFSSFEAAGSRDPERKGGRGGVRTLYQAVLQNCRNKDHTWMFTFTGDGFLRHMVRNMVGTLMEVGSGKMTAGKFEAVLRIRDRGCAGPTAPSCGLILEKVHYEPLVLQPVSR